MKIERIKLYEVTVGRNTGLTTQHVIVRLEAGDGLVGWGEMSDLSHVPLYLFDMPRLEATLNDLLRGRDPRNLAAIEDQLLRFYPDEGHMYARSGLVRQGIDLALHDLLGRFYGIPAHELLGGKLRDRIKVCYPVFRMRSMEEVAPNLERVQDRLDEGFDLIRVYVGADVDVDERFLGEFAARFGSHVSIKSLDFSNLLDWRRAWRATERLARAAEFEMVESVAPRNDLDGLAQFRRMSRWPVSEHVYSLSHGWHLARRDSVDIFNLSPYVLGGLRATLRLAVLAEAANVSVLLGTTQELNLGTAASAHAGAAMRVLDYPSDAVGPRLYTRDVVTVPVRYDDGYLIVPEGPGLGVDVDETMLDELCAASGSSIGTDLATLLDRTPPTTPRMQPS